ncbi:HNH endonuclease [Phaeospirillum tilakii]|uniref:Putative HNH nuclease YajD n=1 Tax=Phaeospirillum tilakii TaxID=741673 RepID=A0ABW5CFR0_9PROT
MPNDPFYRSRAWVALRAQALKRDGYRCVVCGSDVRAKGQSRVDHILPRRQRPDLALALSNLRTLCSICDNQSHREKRTGAQGREERFVVRGCDASGRPIDPKHPWNGK